MTGSGIPLPESKLYIFGQIGSNPTIGISCYSKNKGNSSRVYYKVSNTRTAEYLNHFLPIRTYNTNRQVMYAISYEQGSSDEETPYYLEMYANNWYTMTSDKHSQPISAYSISKTTINMMQTGFIYIHNIRCTSYVWSGYEYLLDAIIDIENNLVKFSKPIKAKAGVITGYTAGMGFLISELSYAEYFETEPSFE